jgi:hypothetical protein
MSPNERPSAEDQALDTRAAGFEAGEMEDTRTFVYTLIRFTHSALDPLHQELNAELLRPP